jgi:hypothetical protein
VKEFMDTSLLLEQYEAQIFSIIRQNLKGGDTKVPSSLLERVFKLILKFLTLPICKDELTLGRISDLLFERLVVDPESIFKNNYSNNEAVLTYSHL